jgi:hypothetical protein
VLITRLSRVRFPPNADGKNQLYWKVASVPRVGKVDAGCSGKPLRLAGPAPTGNSCQCEGTAAPDGEDAGRDIKRFTPRPFTQKYLHPKSATVADADYWFAELKK